DFARVSVVREKLESLGIPLFTDLKIPAGENYLSVLNDQIDTAVAVLVLWTVSSVKLPRSGEPNFALSEAERGHTRNILVAATLDKIAQKDLPLPFNTIQAPDLSDWISSGTPAGHPNWVSVLGQLGTMLNRDGLPLLAIALEKGTDEAKRDFLRQFPHDP